MLTYKNATEALPELLERVLGRGHETASRNGKTRELLMQQVTLTQPDQVEITTVGRRASLPAQIAETMWLLAGRDDIAWLSHYLPRAADFSDDGKTWRGAYGPRIRQYGSSYMEGVDQLLHVVNLLKADPDTRRAVISIYDPAIDAKPGKDIPCNDFLQFVQRDGELHAHVFIRSNDLMWGWSGINAFEWTSLLTIVAGLTGFRRGSITFSITSLHLYERHWDKAKRIVQAHREQAELRLFAQPLRPSPRFQAPATLNDLDELIERWFAVEGLIREGDDRAAGEIKMFPEPMLASWLQVLFAWHHGDLRLVPSLHGTALYQGLLLSPTRKQAAPPAPAQPSLQAFTEFVADLHAEKHKAYGDSWFKRGEQMSIMANIARKVDRLGVAGGGDTSADTAIDLLVYLIKYSMWLVTPEQRLRSQYHADDVTTALKTLQEVESAKPGMPAEQLIELAHTYFDDLEVAVSAGDRSEQKQRKVLRLRGVIYPLAVRLWRAEQAPAITNETRRFNGYATTEDQP